MRWYCRWLIQAGFWGRCQVTRRSCLPSRWPRRKSSCRDWCRRVQKCISPRRRLTSNMKEQK